MLEMIDPLLGPFSDIYFALDQNKNGRIEPNEMKNFFKSINRDKNSFVSR